MKKKYRKSIAYILLVVVLACAGLGCAKNKETGNNNKTIFASVFGKDEVYKIGEETCKIPEMMIYLTNIQDQYENVYGEEIWKASLQGKTLEENVKETVLAKNAQIKSMYLLAKTKGIELDEKEEDLVQKAAGEYFNGLNPTEKELLNVDKDFVVRLYREYALANKVYHDIISQVNPEISDDEARIVTVQDIYFKTYSENAAGERTDYLTDEKQKVHETASQVRALAVDGEHDFAELLREYSDSRQDSVSFGQGEVEKALEEAAFSMSTDEVSEIIVAEDGYHILKCISTFNREETDANKLKIVEKRRNEAFGAEYDEFVNNLEKKLNEEVWDSITLIRDEKVTTENFFEIYNKYLGD